MRADTPQQQRARALTRSDPGELLEPEDLSQMAMDALAASEERSGPANGTASNATDDSVGASSATQDGSGSANPTTEATNASSPSVDPASANPTSEATNVSNPSVNSVTNTTEGGTSDVNTSVPADATDPTAGGSGRPPSMDEPMRPAIGQSEPTGGNKSYGEYSDVVHYNIQCVASGLYLREDPANENKFRLKCEQLDPDDASFRFRFVAETDGRWRIRATASHDYLWEYVVDHEVRGTKSVADTFTSFSMEPQADWSYKMKVKANDHYLYQDSTTNILAGGNNTDDYANFKLVALESAAPCKAYQFQAVCPPNRCWWLKDHCEFTGDIRENGVSRGFSWRVLVVATLVMLICA